MNFVVEVVDTEVLVRVVVVVVIGLVEVEK